MSFVEKLKAEATSLEYTIYAQWSAVISVILLIIIGIVKFISYVFVWSIVGWVFCGIIVILEVPFFTLMFRNGRFEGFLSKFENPTFRAGAYLAAAIVMYLSAIVQSSGFIACGVFLTFVSIFYGLSIMRHQERVSTVLLGGEGILNLPTSSV
ncbi:hypothetical protein CONCODRAFT_77534 [Conidiobolus coronatus NRRL 28638]|uniref:Golgi apparatus membrane protein TVP18 n=1 Tax=Conidiobolus coronatus (strain ATCC 28846 / CBS 209.66 / NRRL 28638) TaxID=796925 RepID=A0A137PDD8_CONC2|nr:hypothetical protein CONCODRAFT_77534 [Conidiobolus coronatus NRRL 28638]|eukprot:KXN73000.1 hypothetical protein CONCODRAFT_77534 [Conidiobolus coronatus NRRL 28638]